MAGTLYGLSDMLPVLSVQKTLPSFWLQYFPNVVNFTTDEIVFDRVFNDDRKLAPFVVPNVQGRVSGLEGYDTRSFKPAYIKDKNVFDPTMPFVRMAGEALGTGSLTPEQRRNAVLAEMLRQQKQRMANRWEWMAAQAAITGKVIVKGEDYPEVTVDFRRHASLTATLSGAALWTAGTATPLADLKSLRVAANYRSGARISRFVFGADAWDLMGARVNLRDQMNMQIDGYGTKVTMITDGYEGYEYVGTIAGLDGSGRLECWVNTAKYIDPMTGNEEFIQDQKTVVGISPAIQGVQCFGAIKDKGAQYRALSIFPKMWEEEDPSVEFLMSQSAPLMVPKQANASFSLKVAT